MEMAVAEREGCARPKIGHFVFRGSPGTGKTTVVRVMAQILHAMKYVGQTKAKGNGETCGGQGGLLFIDEAYELGKGMYGEEARTNPSYAGMVIVIAGYAKDMDVMLNRNAAEDGVAFLQVKAEQEKMKLDGRVERLERLDGFGNGRDAGRVWKELLQCHAQRVFDSPEEKTRVKKKHEANDEAERDAGVSDENWEELERAKEAPAAHLEALKRARDQATREEERRRELEEERRRAAAIQEKIRQICPCPAGFKWYKSGSGWRCGGGSHFVWMHS
ncbi:P-loop containing nucleoside triphosphate hydrolase [Phytophthora cactorum]|nr:P-loop containing nucleoside triphosphate hydrolase [Phytophthora cactorum]